MAIIAAAIITAILSRGSVVDLIIIDVVLLLVPIVLILISGIVLRFRDKDRVWDCFRVKVSNKVFAAMAALPIVIAVYALVTTDWQSLAAGGACLAVGVVMYFIFPKMHKKKLQEHDSSN